MITLNFCQHEWGCDWTLWHFQHKRCPDKLIFGGFNDEPIPSNYYIFPNDGNNYGNNITGTPIDDDLPENKGVEDAAVPNDEDMDNEIIIYGDEILSSDIDPFKTKACKFKECTMKMK